MTVTAQQCAERQAARDNLVQELVAALQAIVDLPSHPMRRKGVEIAIAALTRAKEQA